MAKPFIKEADLIRLTMENVRSFYNRDKGYTTAPMMDDFMWIGSNDFQWCEGLDAFLRVTKNEYEEPPVLLSDEEYHLLFHDHNTWVVYGRYKATVALEDGTVLHAHVRGTYVWRRVDGELRLAHVHGSHAQDIPLTQSPLPQQHMTESTAFFDFMKRIDSLNTYKDKLSFRGRDAMFHYLNAAEVCYLKAKNQGCIVCTKNGELEVSGLLSAQMEHLPPQFQRIHKSYAVNLSHVASICRFKATLLDGTKLPISKEKYMQLKEALVK
ncbi:LytTR family transcriptional regulator [Acetivibrio ethanolgignens]|uniref:Histidine kinase n=1 Tax=Acetivibrio ethanolgignens TaxID=290052 RepID=A0A0V8QCD3_9FIRM|nr:LytTR family transcriptional regulator [Acetivibrio ethanolgignens]KSV58199.1 histidine kinase [Acetivibrio ethanolgignens]